MNMFKHLGYSQNILGAIDNLKFTYRDMCLHNVLPRAFLPRHPAVAAKISGCEFGVGRYLVTLENKYRSQTLYGGRNQCVCAVV